MASGLKRTRETDAGGTTEKRRILEDIPTKKEVENEARIARKELEAPGDIYPFTRISDLATRHRDGEEEDIVVERECCDCGAIEQVAYEGEPVRPDDKRHIRKSLAHVEALQMTTIDLVVWELAKVNKIIKSTRPDLAPEFVNFTTEDKMKALCSINKVLDALEYREGERKP